MSGCLAMLALHDDPSMSKNQQESSVEVESEIHRLHSWTRTRAWFGRNDAVCAASLITCSYRMLLQARFCISTLRPCSQGGLIVNTLLGPFTRLVAQTRWACMITSHTTAMG